MRMAALLLVVIAFAASAARAAGPLRPGEPVPFCPGSVGGNSSAANCTTVAYDPNTPLVPCAAVPAQHMVCVFEDYTGLSDDGYNALTPAQQQRGCRAFGSARGEAPAYVTARCEVYPEIECAGNHTFYLADTYQCVRYGSFRFPTVLALSIFLGLCGIDRLCLCYTCFGSAKLLTLGGLGVWWLVDLVLLTSGALLPNDGYSWLPSW
eukprot:Unigene3486_Nuclearia_a/m.10677 Unigene3486_Nuclearia_a/g.10677  ORF Unigene3486_Nuclearia_a/g.10677 Unigene3486_Nuclearia_a/m.10677 type:complete len:208 (-) Unigene3486_Nuclearia_a:40-663(-)